MTRNFVSSDDIRSRFSRAMSAMYRSEVPQYGTLVELVEEINDLRLRDDPDLAASLERSGELSRLSEERHGAIRLGTPGELATIARVFAVMGMHPVGYYDLSVAGIPVHSTAFRPIDPAALSKNPFRVFTSLLRLDWIEDESLRREAEDILSRRSIFTEGALALLDKAEKDGGLGETDAERFVEEALETFRWHEAATVDRATYERLAKAHRLIADVVCFRGPHINHLTPRTLDIDAVQAMMPQRGISPKAVIEGPPRRLCPILLRQTSFKALEEAIAFKGRTGAEDGTHTARFGEIEQRGVALTQKGRALYDRLLNEARSDASVAASGEGASDYETALTHRFTDFPDNWTSMRAEGLAFFHYTPTQSGLDRAESGETSGDLDALIEAGDLTFDPIVYEDFLPVSAAGIFQSNLSSDAQANASAKGSKPAFEAALARAVHDETSLYAKAEQASIASALSALAPRRRANA